MYTYTCNVFFCDISGPNISKNLLYNIFLNAEINDKTISPISSLLDLPFVSSLNTVDTISIKNIGIDAISKHRMFSFMQYYFLEYSNPNTPGPPFIATDGAFF